MRTLTTSKRFAGLIAILVPLACITAACAQAQNRRHHEPAGVTPAAYSKAVFQICANAVLFEGTSRDRHT